MGKSVDIYFRDGIMGGFADEWDAPPVESSVQNEFTGGCRPGNKPGAVEAEKPLFPREAGVVS